MIVTKVEFMEYLQYINKALKADIPTEPEIIAAWYKPFENVHMIIAKRMANLYLQNESGYFKLAKLLEYKSRALASNTYKVQNNVQCDLCDDTGFLTFEEQRPGYPMLTQICRRCICQKGDRLPNYIRQMTGAELELYGQRRDKVFEKVKA